MPGVTEKGMHRCAQRKASLKGKMCAGLTMVVTSFPSINRRVGNGVMCRRKSRSSDLDE